VNDLKYPSLAKITVRLYGFIPVFTLRNQSGSVCARRGFGGDGFSSCAKQVREKSFWHVANDGVDKPGKRKWHGAAEFDGFDLNVSAAEFLLDVPPGAEFPHVTM
jgi:hypothetical protein